MNLNTRVDLYANEASVLLETMATYRTLYTEQLYKLFPPEKAVTVKMLLKRYARERRLFFSDEGLMSADSEMPINASLMKAFWVLLDFIDKAEYHTAGIFPILICFFVDGELYEIVHVPIGQESMVSVALTTAEKEPSKRIVILDELGQKPKITLKNIAGFCLVGQDGIISYYQ